MELNDQGRISSGHDDQQNRDGEPRPEPRIYPDRCYRSGIRRYARWPFVELTG